MGASISFDRRLVLPQHVATRELDGELVLLNFDTETYFGLDAMGRRMVEVLRSAATLDAGIAVLLEEFDVQEDRLRADVAVLVGSLIEGGLVALEPA